MRVFIPSSARQGDFIEKSTLKPNRRPSKRPPVWKGRRREQSAVFPALTQTGETEHRELLLTWSRVRESNPPSQLGKLE